MDIRGEHVIMFHHLVQSASGLRSGDQAAESSGVEWGEQPGHVTGFNPPSLTGRPVTVTGTRGRREVPTSPGLARGHTVKSQEVNPAASINSPLEIFMASDRLCGVGAAAGVFSVYSIHCVFSIKAAHIDSHKRSASFYGFFPPPL